MVFIGYPNWWGGLCRKCFIKENRPYKEVLLKSRKTVQSKSLQAGRTVCL